MALIRNLKESFSWRLALVFIAVGVVAALIIELLVSDYDHEGFIQSDDGLRLVYETQGEGPPLVVLAGGPGISHHGFHPYIGRLRNRAKVVYFDPRGRGDSGSASRYRVADDVRDLESLRRGLDHERVDLLGVSYGAHLAVAYALEHPQKIRKLVLVAPLVGRSAWQAHLEILLNAPGMASTLRQIRGRRKEVRLTHLDTRERIVRTLMPLYWCHPNDAAPHAGPSRRRHWIARQNFDIYEAIVGTPFGELNGDLASSEIETRLNAIDAPALLVVGGCDGIIPKDHVERLARQLPRAEVVRFSEAGHSPFVDEPKLFAETVGEFLERPGR